MILPSYVILPSVEPVLSTLDLYAEEVPRSEKPYLNFVIEDELLKRIDDFRYAQRFPSRAAAVKALLEWALARPDAKDCVPRPEEEPPD